MSYKKKSCPLGGSSKVAMKRQRNETVPLTQQHYLCS